MTNFVLFFFLLLARRALAVAKPAAGRICLEGIADFLDRDVNHAGRSLSHVLASYY
jgi:hypothetical protein